MSEEEIEDFERTDVTIVTATVQNDPHPLGRCSHEFAQYDPLFGETLKTGSLCCSHDMTIYPDGDVMCSSCWTKQGWMRWDDGAYVFMVNIPEEKWGEHVIRRVKE